MPAVRDPRPLIPVLPLETSRALSRICFGRTRSRNNTCGRGSRLSWLGPRCWTTTMAISASAGNSLSNAVQPLVPPRRRQPPLPGTEAQEPREGSSLELPGGPSRYWPGVWPISSSSSACGLLLPDHSRLRQSGMVVAQGDPDSQLIRRRVRDSGRGRSLDAQLDVDADNPGSPPATTPIRRACRRRYGRLPPPRIRRSWGLRWPGAHGVAGGGEFRTRVPHAPDSYCPSRVGNSGLAMNPASACCTVIPASKP
jgi:hypothetical protein